MFRWLFPASLRLRMLAAAAIATLGLSACGGGGGGGGTGALGPSLTAGGVTAAIEYSGGSPVITISKGDTEWTDNPGVPEAEPTGWEAVTKLNAPEAMATERFRAVGTIASATDNDYLLFGYWSRLSLDGMEDYKPFYYGKTPYTGNVREQTGSVDYNGVATGVVQEESATSGANEVIGRFNAVVARVRVNFGLNTDAPQIQLHLGAFEIINSNGSIELLPPSGTDGFATASATGPSFYDQGDRDGFKVWGGQFYGPSGSVPTGVAGWFRNVRTVGGSKTYLVHGTFAAKKE